MGGNLALAVARSMMLAICFTALFTVALAQSTKLPTKADLDMARQYIDEHLSAENRGKLEEIARSANLSPAEVFLSLSAQDVATLGRDTGVRDLVCRSLRTQYSQCSSSFGQCAEQCTKHACTMRLPSIRCEAAPTCDANC